MAVDTPEVAVSAPSPAPAPAAPQQDGSALAELQAQLARQAAERAALEADLAVAQIKANAPDGTFDAEGRLQYLERELKRVYDEKKTDAYIRMQLDELYRATGVTVLPGDARLSIHAGKDAFDASVRAIKAEIMGARDRERLKEELRAEVLREQGATTFDGAGSAAAPTSQRRTFRASEIEAMSIEEYTRNRDAIMSGRIIRG